jgi:hypothetical protein
MFWQNIDANDTNSNEATLWRDWYFGPTPPAVTAVITGQYPLRSAWFWPPRTRLRPNVAMFWQNIDANDTNGDEAALWNNWYFGTTSFNPAWATQANFSGGSGTGM